MVKNQLSFFIVLFFLIAKTIFPQPHQPRFNKYNVQNGLSQSMVTSIMQDTKGFMWFGTQDGLNRFDGYNFVVYRHIPGDSTTLSENWIWDIYEDKNNYIWCGTFGGGASRYNKNTQSFKSFRHVPGDSTSISDPTIWTFCEDNNGVLWIGANNGLNKYDEVTETFTFFPPLGRQINVYEIYPVNDDLLLTRTGEGLMLFSVKTQTFKKLKTKFDETDFITKDGSGIFWIGNSEKGIRKIDLENYYLNHENDTPLKTNEILPYNGMLDVISDNKDFLWSATRNGLSISKLNKNKIISNNNYYHNINDKESLSSNHLIKIYQSRGGEIWISARDALNKFDYNNQKFKHTFHLSGVTNSLSKNGVLPILASNKNKNIIWIGTRNGLNRFDKSTGKFTHIFHNPNEPNNSLSGNYILSLLEDVDGSLWVGTRNKGLTHIIFKNNNAFYKTYKHNPNDNTSLGRNNVHSIYRDKSGRLWVGTGGGGLNLFNEKKNNFTHFMSEASDTPGISGNWVYNITEDKEGNLWLGTAAFGLNFFDTKKNTFKHFQHDANNNNSLSNNRVLSTHISKSGDLWVGTALGLNKLVKSENNEFHFERYYESDGLPNDVIYGILEDDNNNLWVSTNKGISKVSIASDNISTKNYFVEDGLQSNEFDQNSFAKDSDGNMYFGGINGFNSFHPDSVKDNSFIPEVVITDLKIMNESVPIGGPDLSAQNRHSSFVLDKSIIETDSIFLSYTDDVISFEFAALNFTVPERNSYAYMMQGFDHDWIYSGTRRFVTYTNLDPGEYVFKVKGSNNDDVWNEEGIQLYVFVSPPPWATWWAYTGYTLFIMGIGFLFIKRREGLVKKEMEIALKIDKAKAEERENVRKKTSQDFHDEAGNKLTKISLFTTLAKRECSEETEVNKYLSHIEENTKELSNGMRDFLWVLDAGKDSLYDMIKRLEEFGNSMFEFTDTNYLVEGNLNEFKTILLPMETRRTLILIFKEAMNNSLKYSNAKNVLLTVSLSNNILQITLSDNGIGFDEKKTTNGYGLTNMQSRAESVNGNIEMLTSENNGTKITFTGNTTQMGN